MAVLAFSGWAGADPPARVGRLSFISGSVSFSPAGEQEWVEARVNRPLIAGDRLWVDSGSRAELQVGTSALRMGPNTSVTLLNLDDRVVQVQLAQGALNIRVRRFGSADVVEIDTPNLAYSITQPGQYRVDVDPTGAATTAIVRSGRADVYGEGVAYVVNAQEAFRFAGSDLRDYDYLESPRADAFDRWADDRDRRADNSASARYVSRDVIGYEDLDEYGSWRAAEGYGNVWVPNRVAAGWTPYHDGNWTWVEPWGWTWVDDAPWGFAVSHYGRWANLRGTWGWVPGPVTAQPVYAPALVAFVGGEKFRPGSSGGAVGWFPLGPRDVYRPSYPVSRGYFNNVNTSNTTVNNTTITNVYNNTNVSNVTYVNQHVTGAVTAVPATAFVQAQPVGRHATRMSREDLARAPVTAVAAVAPVETSVHGGAPQGRRPPEAAQARPVVANAPPPARPVPFAARQHALAADPGKPLAAAALAAAAIVAAKTAAPAPAEPVKVVTPTQPAVAPPKQEVQSADKADAKRGLSADARKGSQPSESRQGRPPLEANKGATPPEAQNAQPVEVRKGPMEEKKAPQSPDATKAPQPPEAQKGQQPDAQRGRPPFERNKGPQSSDEKKVSQPPEVQKGPPPEPPKAPPAVSVPRPPETQKGPPPVSAPRPPDAVKGPPPEAQKAPSPPVSVPRPPEPSKAPPPEVQKAPPPPVVAPRPPEPPKAPLLEAQKAPSPPVITPRPPEPPKAPPAPVSVPRPPDAQKAPPPIPDAKALEKKGEQRVREPRPDSAKGGNRKSDEQLKLEEEEKKRKP